MADLKTLSNGKQSLKRFVLLKEVLEAQSVHQVGNDKLEDVQTNVQAGRQATRVLLACQSAALIIKKGRVADIKAFEADLKSLMVTLPT